ncbi:MAG: TlpA family protein disulfide reductase [Thiomicrorhabdus sp.]|nr:TlpA family protein disulfide reductase [Thiomicrorhabdus sp.]
MLKKRGYIGLLIGILVVLQGCDDSSNHQVAVGKPFPDMTLVTYDKEPFTLEQLRGKVVILKLWATWCSVCREEAPHFLAFSEKLDESVVIASLSVDQNLNSAKEYLLDHPNGFLQLFDQSMVQTKVILKVNVIPQVYLIDQEGILRYFAVGLVDWDEEMLKKVQRLLDEGGSE